MSLLLVALLAAAPVHVIAVHGPKSEEVLQRLKAIPGVTIVDATALHTYLLRTEGLFPMQDFEGFSAAPVPEWAPASAEIWKKGITHCRTLVGEPPFKELGAALTCANRLSSYLWQQYAAQLNAARVFEVEVSVDDRKGKANVRGGVWEPSSRDQLFFDENCKLAQLDQTLERVLTALIEKKGPTQARNVIAQLESALLGDPFVGQTKATSPVTFKKTCAALPKSITVTPAGLLTDSLVARWTPEGAKGAPLACTLTFNEHTESGVGEVISVMTTLMTCSSTVVTADVAKAGAARSTVDIVSERLVQGLATKLCK